MKRLRILSGAHAGASLVLEAGEHTVGSATSCDVLVSDWRFAPLKLQVSESGGVVASWSGARSGKRELNDLEPAKFKGVYMCVGPADSAWPSDATLLGARRGGPLASLLPGLPKLETRMAQGAAAMLALLLGGSGLSWALAGSRTPPPPSIEQVRSRLEARLQPLAPGQLQVQVDKNRLIVSGMVDGEAGLRAVHKEMDSASSPYGFLTRVSVATDVAQEIVSSVGAPGAEVTYRGNGTFSFKARVEDVEGTIDAINRVKADLQPQVRSIEPLLTEAPGNGLGPASLSQFTDDAVSVVQTRDGVKHIVVPENMSLPTESPALLEAPGRPASQTR